MHDMLMEKGHVRMVIIIAQSLILQPIFASVPRATDCVGRAQCELNIHYQKLTDTHKIPLRKYEMTSRKLNVLKSK